MLPSLTSTVKPPPAVRAAALGAFLRVPSVVTFVFCFLDRLSVGGRRTRASALAGVPAGASLALTGWMLVS
jgi:hypothetical protein